MAKYIEFRRILSLIPHLPPASFYSPFAGSWRPPDSGHPHDAGPPELLSWMNLFSLSIRLEF